MTSHRFVLEPYKGTNSRYQCPRCGKWSTFSRYIDNASGVYLHPTVGRCNREVECGYHYKPKDYFKETGSPNHRGFENFYTNTRGCVRARAECSVLKPHSPSLIPFESFEKSLHHHSENNFVKFLYDLFGTEITTGLIEKYFIGTSKHWNGATVFWQIDITGRVRTGKIMLYNAATGKRIKEPFNHFNWVHSVLKLPEFNLQQCFFGEHLLRAEPGKPIAVVESEKTAIIASVYLPEFIWIATGGINGCGWTKPEIFKVLVGRSVTLFPDLSKPNAKVNCFEKWGEKAGEMLNNAKKSDITKHYISDLLEKNASDSEREQGLDLADYLIRFDYREFQ